MMDIEIDLGNEYTKFPSGRDSKDGTYNGESYREEHLIPRVKKIFEKENLTNLNIIVNIDNTIVHGSSFFEEVLNGLFRSDSLTQEMKGKIKIAIRCTLEYKKMYKELIEKNINKKYLIKK